jgi:rod shape-determining protein MreC
LLEKERQTEEIVELHQALGIVSEAAEWAPLAASVVSRDPSPFSDVVRINQGSSAGIRSGMVVLSAGGSLVGTVTEVYSGQAFVRLITDSRSAVNAQVFESKIDGSLRGTPTKGLQLELAQGEINVGDNVITSGVGDNYPAGLPIGRVSAVGGSAQDVFRNVTVEPAVRMSTLRTVLVLTGFQTGRLDLGGN